MMRPMIDLTCGTNPTARTMPNGKAPTSVKANNPNVSFKPDNNAGKICMIYVILLPPMNELR